MSDESPYETTPVPPGAAPAAVRQPVAAALQLAAIRARTVDDHMFTVSADDGGPASFRLQLFTAPGARPVAVATQTPYEGVSLTNGAERLASVVWERLCRGEELPPLWVQRHLHGEGAADFYLDEDEFQLVSFTAASPFRVRGPGWSSISAEQLGELVGGPVDTGRGSGYVEPEPEEEPQLRFEVMAVSRLTTPPPFDDECMSAALPWWRRWLRQAVPLHGTRDCCWYHGGDWHQVSRMAIDVLAEAEAQGVEAADMYVFADEYAVAAGASAWQRSALDSLFSLAVAIQPYRSGGYINGQHRSRVQIEAGVRRTVVLFEV